MMKTILRSTLAIAIGLSLAACNSSSSDDSSNLQFGGSGVKGTVISGQVDIYRAGDLTTSLGQAQTAIDGTYSIELDGVTGGAFVVAITADADTTMICDAPLCDGTYLSGATIPTASLTDLRLTTFVYADSTAPVTANANALSTMATDTVLAAAATNPNLDLSLITSDQVTDFQQDASEVVGSIIGVDLSTTNLYSIVIADASNADNLDGANAKTATLSLVNAALAGLTPVGAQTMTETLNAYLADVKAVATAVVGSSTPSTVDITALVNKINLVQDQIIIQATELATNLSVTNSDTLAEEITDTVIKDTLGDIVIPSGASGGVTSGGTGEG